MPYRLSVCMSFRKKTQRQEPFTFDDDDHDSLHGCLASFANRAREASSRWAIVVEGE